MHDLSSWFPLMHDFILKGSVGPNWEWERARERECSGMVRLVQTGNGPNWVTIIISVHATIVIRFTTDAICCNCVLVQFVFITY